MKNTFKRTVALLIAIFILSSCSLTVMAVPNPEIKGGIDPELTEALMDRTKYFQVGSRWYAKNYREGKFIYSDPVMDEIHCGGEVNILKKEEGVQWQIFDCYGTARKIRFKYVLPEAYYNNEIRKGYVKSVYGAGGDNPRVELIEPDSEFNKYYCSIGESGRVSRDGFAYPASSHVSLRAELEMGGSRAYFFNEDDEAKGELEALREERINCSGAYHVSSEIIEDSADRLVVKIYTENHGEKSKNGVSNWAYWVYNVMDYIEEIPGAVVTYEVRLSREVKIDSQEFELTEEQKDAIEYRDKLEEEFEKIALEITKMKPTGFSSEWSKAAGIVEESKEVESEEVEAESEEEKEVIPPIHTEVVKEAEETEGEDSGVSIPKLIFGIACGAAAAALAVAGAAGKKKASRKDGDDDEGIYKLYVEKDFGNKLKLGDIPRNIKIKVKKLLPDGTVINRTDLGDSITVESGKYITVGAPTGRSDYLVTAAKTVSLAVEEFPEGVTEDYISIVFSAEGGTLTEHLYFKLLGKTAITFPQQEHYLSGLTIPAAAGDGLTYKVPFVFENALKEPEKIEFTCENSGVELSVEKTGDFSYNAVFKNNTEEIPRVYKNTVKSLVEIHAKFPLGSGDDKVEGEFRVEFFPEGLSIQTNQLKDDLIQINSFQREKIGDLESKIPPVYLTLHIVLKDEEDGIAKPKFVKLKTNMVTLGEIKAAKDEKYVEQMLPKFEYETSEYDIEDGTYIIYPKKELPAFYSENDKFKNNPMQYEVILPVNAEIENKKYTLDAPAVINGKVIDKMGQWQDEYEKLVDVIKRYVPEAEKEKFLKIAEENSKYRSVEELRIQEKSIIQEAIRRYTAEGTEQAEWADTLDWVVGGLEWTKWIGDVAFSYVATAYTGAVGEAILTPCKDIFTSACAELAGNLYFGTEFDADNLEVFKNLYSMGENAIGSNIDIKDFADPQKFKKAMYFVAGFLIYNIFETMILNYEKQIKKAVSEGKDPDSVSFDLLGACLDGFTNLTSKLFQDLAGLYVEKLLSNEKFREKLGNIMGDWLKGMLNSKMLDDIAVYKKGSYAQLDEAWKEILPFDKLPDKAFGDAAGDLSSELYVKFLKSEIVENYLKKLVGDGVAGIYSSAAEAQKTVKEGDWVFPIVPFTTTDDDGERLALVINFSAMKRNLVEWGKSVGESGAKAVNEMSEFFNFIYEHTVFSLVTPAEKPVEFSKDVPIETKGSI